MVLSKQIGVRIVASWPGAGTAETIYQTEDGSVWRSKSITSPTPVSDSGTITQRIGKICGDFIIG